MNARFLDDGLLSANIVFQPLHIPPDVRDNDDDDDDVDDDDEDEG